MLQVTVQKKRPQPRGRQAGTVHLEAMPGRPGTIPIMGFAIRSASKFNLREWPNEAGARPVADLPRR
jgi:hypothetical protein